MRLDWKAARTATVGRTTPPVTVDATATVGSTVTWALGLVGAASIEGSVNASGVVHAPEGSSAAALRLAVPLTGIPASGPMNVPASGTAPGRVFREPGPGTVTVGDSMTMHIVPRDAGGNPIPAGEVDLSCTLDPGQDAVLFAFEITPAPPSPGNTGRATTSTARPAQPGPGGSAGTAGPAVPGPGGSSPVTTTPNADQPTTTLSAPELTTTTEPKIANTASATVVRQPAGPLWWLIGAGVLIMLVAAHGGLWLLRRRKT